MSKERGRKSAGKLGWAAAGVAGLIAAAPGTIVPAEAGRAGALKQQDDGCPQAATAGALRTIASAQTDYNNSSGAARKPALKKKAAKKTAKKATRKTAKKALGKGPARKLIRKKATKKTARKRAAQRRNPC